MDSFNYTLIFESFSRDDIDRKFGMFSYQKGGSIIRMMEQVTALHRTR